MARNMFDIPRSVPAKGEVFEDILQASTVWVKRIVSCGYTSPNNFWYDQPEDEWIVIMQGWAHLLTKDGQGKTTLFSLKAGDSMLLKARQKHRIEQTSRRPKTIWLVLHGNIVYEETVQWQNNT